MEIDAAVLRQLSKLYPTVDAASAAYVRKSAERTLPLGTVHLISDIHGDADKLQHVLNNGSGTLRPVVEKLFQGDLTADEVQRLLFFIFYPTRFAETHGMEMFSDVTRVTFLLTHVVALIRHQSRSYTITHVTTVLPEVYRTLMLELLYSPAANDQYVRSVGATMVSIASAFRFLRHLAHVVRNLATVELVAAGDFWDRGPRGDVVMDILMRQPAVWITWGNHDLAWLGACLGSEALIAHVLRVSIRYNVLQQLEEGYGISLQALENLASTVYGDDTSMVYKSKKPSHRDPHLLARMQKACAIMQFKLEGQAIRRNDHFQLTQDMVLHTVDATKGTIIVDGKEYPLRDSYFPTLDTKSADPYQLTPEEATCMEALRRNFFNSHKLWEQMKFLTRRGSSWCSRHGNLVFHAAVPVDEGGEFLGFPVNGKDPVSGRALYDALNSEVVAAMAEPTQARRDLLWYLWCGPRSPFMGKDRVATLMRDLIEDPVTHVEKKNPYFKLIKEEWFCEKVLREFGCNPDGLIVNGHTPVAVAKGESPMKSSRAVVIDGAFSAAYGDHGFTLIMDDQKVQLAEHSHAEDAFAVCPTIKDIKAVTQPETSPVGDEAVLKRLLEAYWRNEIPQRHS